MQGQIKLPTQAFSAALREYLKTTKRDVAEVLNSKMGDVALRAVGHTVRASYTQMSKKMKRGGNFGKTLKSGRQSKGKSARYQTFNPSGWVYAVLNYYKKHGRMPSWAIGIMPKKIARAPVTKAAAIHFVNAKLRSIAYIAVGFIMAAKFFGKAVTTKVSTKGWAAKSTGKKATPLKLTAKIMNYSREAGGKAFIPSGAGYALRKALDSVTDDMLAHVSRKMQASAKKAGFVKKP